MTIRSHNLPGRDFYSPFDRFMHSISLNVASFFPHRVEETKPRPTGAYKLSGRQFNLVPNKYCVYVIANSNL